MALKLDTNPNTNFAASSDLLRQAARPQVVVKLGGSALEHAQPVLADVVTLWHAGWQPVVVHGGGPQIDAWLRRLDITPRFIDGRRVTDAATLEVVRAVLIGQINSELVRLLETMDGSAIGLSGIDAGLIRTRRAPEPLGLVGIVESVNVKPVIALCQAGFIPVIAPLSLGPDDECVNVNADDVATAIASAMGASALLFLSNVPGVRDGSGDLVPQLDRSSAAQMIAAGVISGGMVPKIQSCLAALDRVQSVHIIDGTMPHVLLRALEGREHPGTCIVDVSLPSW